MSGPAQDEEIHKSPLPVRLMTGAASLGLAALAAAFATIHLFGAAVNKALVFVFFAAWAAAAAGFLVFRIADFARSRKWRKFDRWSYLPALALVIVFTYCAISIPPLLFHRGDDKEADQAAHSAGARAELAQKKYFSMHQSFSKDLDELLRIDPAIGAKPEITFKFDQGDQSGYRFSTHYNKSRFIYRFSSKGILMSGPPMHKNPSPGESKN